jgi:glycosyltransferase involved in cell wall biosynthesis
MSAIPALTDVLGNRASPLSSPRPVAAAAVPRISVVIATRGRPELLRRCLSALLGQDIEAQAYEVVVVDDGPSEETRLVVENLAPAAGVPRLRYLVPKYGHGPAVARNAGWRAAYGDLIAFTDDDTIPEPNWLAEGAGALEAGQVAVAGRIRVPPLAGPGELPTDHELMTRGLESVAFATANAFVRRAALQAIGGFDECFERAWREDSDLQFRLERDVGPVGRCPEAVVAHPVRPEPWGVCLRQQRNTYFEPLLYKKHPRLYRERIRRSPPWNYYYIVGLSLAALVLRIAGVTGSALIALLLAVLLILQLTVRRLRHTSRSPAHVLEMLVTSAIIPFLSVYWRIRGALKFRVWYL